MNIFFSVPISHTFNYWFVHVHLFHIYIIIILICNAICKSEIYDNQHLLIVMNDDKDLTNHVLIFGKTFYVWIYRLEVTANQKYKVVYTVSLFFSTCKRRCRVDEFWTSSRSQSFDIFADCDADADLESLLCVHSVNYWWLYRNSGGTIALPLFQCRSSNLLCTDLERVVMNTKSKKTGSKTLLSNDDYRERSLTNA